MPQTTSTGAGPALQRRRTFRVPGLTKPAAAAAPAAAGCPLPAAPCEPGHAPAEKPAVAGTGVKRPLQSSPGPSAPASATNVPSRPLQPPAGGPFKQAPFKRFKPPTATNTQQAAAASAAALSAACSPAAGTASLENVPPAAAAGASHPHTVAAADDGAAAAAAQQVPPGSKQTGLSSSVRAARPQPVRALSPADPASAAAQVHLSAATSPAPRSSFGTASHPGAAAATSTGAAAVAASSRRRPTHMSAASSPASPIPSATGSVLAPAVSSEASPAAGGSAPAAAATAAAGAGAGAASATCLAAAGASREVDGRLLQERAAAAAAALSAEPHPLGPLPEPPQELLLELEGCRLSLHMPGLLDITCRLAQLALPGAPLPSLMRTMVTQAALTSLQRRLVPPADPPDVPGTPTAAAAAGAGSVCLPSTEVLLQQLHQLGAPTVVEGCLLPGLTWKDFQLPAGYQPAAAATAEEPSDTGGLPAPGKAAAAGFGSAAAAAAAGRHGQPDSSMAWGDPVNPHVSAGQEGSVQVLNAGGVADVTGPAAGVHWGSCLGLDDWVSPGRLQELQLLL